MKNIRSFTALDFETLTAERSSACAIGLVKVIDGYITQKFYSLIKPIQDTRTSDNSTVHGITRDMVANAPTFQQLWPSIQDFIGSDIIVCHNVTFDKSVWDEQIQYYSCQSDLHCYRFFCTYQMTGLSLKDACAKHNIEIGCHHDALDDAVACAKVMLAENGVMQVRTFSGGASAARKLGGAKKYDHATLSPLEDSQIENKETPFFHARTVITGIFSAYPNRNELGKLLQSLGADINTSISRKTNVVVVGNGAGPSKLQKIEELRTGGHEIRIIYEPELISLLS